MNRDARWEEHFTRLRLEGPAGPVEDVRCQLRMPPPGAEKPRLQLRPTAAQYPRLHGPKLTNLSGPLFAACGEVLGEVRCREAWVLRDRQTYRGGETEAVIDVDIVDDFDLTRFFRDDKATLPTQVWFWISPNRLLTPPVNRTLEASGEITVDRPRPIEVRLTSDIVLQFDQQYDSWYEGEVLHQAPRLVATARLPGRAVEPELLQQLDDQLLLASFLARRRTACSGWTLSVPGRVTAHYRGAVGAPGDYALPSLTDGVIERGQVVEFFETAWPAFQARSDPEAIRHLIYTCVPQAQLVLEGDVLNLWASLEDFLLACRARSDLHHIVHAARWPSLREQLKDVITSPTNPPLSKHQRAWFHQNLAGLNRVPLQAVFEHVIDQLEVPVDDLWPVFDGTQGPSLYRVRNRLIHGGGPLRDAVFTLSFATEHLRWLIERIILAALRWPLGRSDVAPEKLAGRYTSMTEWRDARERLRRALEPATPPPEDTDDTGDEAL